MVKLSIAKGHAMQIYNCLGQLRQNKFAEHSPVAICLASPLSPTQDCRKNEAYDVVDRAIYLEL